MEIVVVTKASQYARAKESAKPQMVSDCNMFILSTIFVVSPNFRGTCFMVWAKNIVFLAWPPNNSCPESY